MAGGSKMCVIPSRLLLLAASVWAVWLPPAPAAAFELALPIACTPNEDCFIQNLPDRDPGPEARDASCASLSYDGHDGTDFALPTLAAMEAGVEVLASAPGIVRGLRDGMPDISIRAPGAPSLEGRDCGNGVALTHEGGWETQYCHMKQGSIIVREGQRVAAGEVLGQVGLSGNTEFPHLHLTVRQNGEWVDPFDPDDRTTCNTPSPPLWAEALPPAPGGLISIGLATEVPDYAQVKDGLPPQNSLPGTAPALVLWAQYFGNRAGDRLDLTLSGPQNTRISETITLDRTQARGFRAFGKRLRDPAGWPRGDWLAEAALIRDGIEIDRQTVPFRVGD